MRLRLIALALGAFAALVVAGDGASASSAAAMEPTISLSSQRGAPGDTILVSLQGWADVTTIVVCGNEARRGAVDCDLVGGVGVGASLEGVQQRELLVAAPPTTCPCVVRASTAGEQIVRTVSFEVLGVPVGPVVGPAAPAGSSLQVFAHLVDDSPSIIDGLRSALGGRTRRTLVLTLTNTGTAPISSLTGTAALGRGTQGGEPLQLPTIDPLAPGETRPYTVQVNVAAPAAGTYVVYGTIYGPGAAVTFNTATTTRPVLLFLLLGVLVTDLIAIAVLRIAAAPTRGERRANTI